MTASQIIELMNRSPFQPLEIHLSDGGIIHVEHPYELATRPNSAVCVVHEQDDRARFISIRNITEIVTPSPLAGTQS